MPYDYDRTARVAREAPYPQQDLKGSGEWAVYFETDDPKTIHRWKFRLQAVALSEAVKAQKANGGYVTVMHKGREVNEVGPGGKVTKNARFIVARIHAVEIRNGRAEVFWYNPAGEVIITTGPVAARDLRPFFVQARYEGAPFEHE